MNVNIASSDIDEALKWRDKIPYINFPSYWSIKIVPAFGNAIIRFVVKYKEIKISVYLDGYEALGFYYDDNQLRQPYWEIYPDKDGDIDRFDLNDVEGLIATIYDTFNYKETEDNL